jgi:hypothetical protein
MSVSRVRNQVELLAVPSSSSVPLHAETTFIGNTLIKTSHQTQDWHQVSFMSSTSRNSNNYLFRIYSIR